MIDAWAAERLKGSGAYLQNRQQYQEQQELMLRYFGHNGFPSACSKLSVYPIPFRRSGFQVGVATVERWRADAGHSRSEEFFKAVFTVILDKPWILYTSLADHPPGHLESFGPLRIFFPNVVEGDGSPPSRRSLAFLAFLDTTTEPGATGDPIRMCRHKMRLGWWWFCNRRSWSSWGWGTEMTHLRQVCFCAGVYN